MNVYQIVYKLELNTRVFLGTSSEVTSLLEMTTSLVGVFCSTRSTCIKGTDTEATSIEDTCIGISYIRVVNIEGVKNTFIRGTSVKGANWDVLLTQPSLFDSKSACIGNTSVGDTYGRGAYIGNTSTGGAGVNASTIKHLRNDS